MQEVNNKWLVFSGLIIFLFISFLLAIFIWYFGDALGLQSQSGKVYAWLASVCFYIVARIFWFTSRQYTLRKQQSHSELSGRTPEKESRLPVTSKPQLSKTLSQYLHSHFGLIWRHKIRLLLITGEDESIERLIPGLRTQLWLESRRTVLIYGGSLTIEPDSDTLAALRKLRRGRPLDGIIHVMGASERLTPQRSDNDLRGLERLGERLHYQPPVYLWQLCHSDWSQQGRTPQAVGVTFPRRASAESVKTQFTRLLPQLREQGMAQIMENPDWDFLLRLARQLEQGEAENWQAQLAPWLFASQRRVMLRGVMFSLPQPVPPEQTRSSGFPHASVLSASWQGVIDDCTCVRGRRTGMAWERTAAITGMAILGIWGAGLLIAFTTNRAQILSVAQKARALVQQPAVSDAQLTALHALRNDAGRLRHHIRQGAPWYQRFGLDHSRPLFTAMMPWYGAANNRLIRDPASAALKDKLSALISSPPDSTQRTALAKPGYDQLKAWLMMANPSRVDETFYAQTLQQVQPVREGMSAGLWQSLAPDLWRFYMSELPQQPQWAIGQDSAMVGQSRQVLLQQIGRRNAESTLYNAMLDAVRRNVADMTLEDMTRGTDVSRLFSTSEVLPGIFTRQAWEEGIQQAIEQAASTRRDEIDWVLSDNRKPLAENLSPEALKARLTERYFSDFAASWLGFLNSLHWNQTDNIADVTDQLTLIGDVRQSPVIALMNTLAWQGQAGQQRNGISDSLLKSAKALIRDNQQPVIDQQADRPAGPLDSTFGPLLNLMGKNSSRQVAVDDALSLQSWLTRITRVRLRLQQVANAADPQAMMQSLAQSVFQGKSVDLTDTRQYGSLVAASLGEAWHGFGNTLFVQPLTQAWETVLQPSAASLNDQWRRSVVEDWQSAFEGRYPFTAADSDVSLPMLAEFIRRDRGRIERFLSRELSGVLHKQGNEWVPDSAQRQGLKFNPAFLAAVNQLSRLADILFTDGTQGINFELQARPAAEIVETRLSIDGQSLHYFNQLADWQAFRWPGETARPGTLLTWTSTTAGARLFGDYSGTWGLIRWLEQSQTQQLDPSRWLLRYTAPDGRRLAWVLRAQLGEGPLALLGLRGFVLPQTIFTVDETANTVITKRLFLSREDEKE